MLRRCLVFILAAALCGAPVGAGDHLVSPKAADAKLAAASKERTQDLATLDNALSSPTMVKTATSAGVDLAKIKGALPSLSDGELRDLAARARSLRSDVVAGHYYYHDDAVDTVFAMMLILALVAAVLIVADNY